MKNLYPTILVILQLGSLLFLLMSGPKLASTTAGFLTEAAGVFLGLLAIYVMKLGNFNIRPIVKKNGILITSGPYRLIRHPMYTAQIIAVIPLVIESFTYIRLAVLILLIVVLIVKIYYEEKRLVVHFEDYGKYMLTTKRLIPYIY